MADSLIRPVLSPAEFEICNAMQREYLAWREVRYAAELPIVHKYDDPAEVEAELALTPVKYALPEGCCFLAWLDGEAVGCASFRAMAPGIAELKRIYVRETARGHGLGRRLTLAAMDTARDHGYKLARLDTGFRQFEAHALYEQLGFRRIGPYYTCPPELEAILIFMEREL